MNYFNLKSYYTVILHVLITDPHILPSPKSLNSSVPITSHAKLPLTVSFGSQIGGLNVKIASVNREGQLVITFNKLIDIPDPGNLNSSIVMSLRQLVNGEYVEYQVQFKYQTFIGDKAYFQVTFPNPYNVSANGAKDTLFIRFNKEFDIVSKKLNEPLLTKKASCFVPEQLVDQFLRSASTVGKTTWYICSVIMVAAALLQFCCGMNLFLLWGILQTLQIIVHIPLLTLLVPINVLLFLDLSNFITSFNFIPTGLLLQSVFNFTRDNSTDVISSGDYSKVYHVRDQYSSNYFIRNTGDFLMLFFFLSFCFLLGKLKIFSNLGTQISTKYPCLKRGVDYLRNKIFYSSLIRSFQLWYLKLTISAYIGFYTINYTDTLSRVSSIFDIAFMGPLFVIIYFIYLFLQTKKHKLNEPSFRNKYEALYINLDIKKKDSWWYCHIFLLRRFVYMLSIIYLGQFPVLQIAVYLILSVLWYSYLLSYDPMLRDSQWRVTEFANETTILICGYLNFLFTDYIPDAELRYKIGWFFIFVLLIDMIFNWILIVLLPIITKLKQVLKKRMEKRVKKGAFRYNPKINLLNLQERRPKDIVQTESRNHRSVQIKQAQKMKKRENKEFRQRNNISIPETIYKFNSTLFLDSEKEDAYRVRKVQCPEMVRPNLPSILLPSIKSENKKNQFSKSEEILEVEKPSNQQAVLEHTLMFKPAVKQTSEFEEKQSKIQYLTKKGSVREDLPRQHQQIDQRCNKIEKKSRVSFFFPEIDTIAMNEKKSLRKSFSFVMNQDDYYKEKKSLGLPYWTEPTSNLTMANQLPYRNSKAIITHQPKRSITRSRVLSPTPENKLNGSLLIWLPYFQQCNAVVDVEDDLEHIETKRKISRMPK